MRILLLIVFLFGFPIAALSSEGISVNELVVKENVRYGPDDGLPYTGSTVDYYDNGHEKQKMMFRKGVKHGKETSWYDDGQLKSVVIYKVGKPQSYGSQWYKPSTKTNKDPEKFMSCENLASNNPLYKELCGDIPASTSISSCKDLSPASPVFEELCGPWPVSKPTYLRFEKPSP